MKIGFFAVLSVVPLGWGLSRAESIEDVEKSLMEAHTRLQSYTADIKHKEHVPLAGSDYMASDVTGHVEWKRKGGEILYRMEITGAAIHFISGKEQKSEQTSVLVSDGKLFYTFAEQLGQKRFIKQNADNSISGDIRSVLEKVRVDNNFKLGADDKVDGADCHVIEVTPKIPPADDKPIHITLIFFRKDIGLCVRVLSRNKEGKDVYDHTLVNLKADVPIEASRFVLHPPPGVEVTDLTGIENFTPSPPEPQPKP